MFDFQPETNRLTELSNSGKVAYFSRMRLILFLLSVLQVWTLQAQKVGSKEIERLVDAQFESSVNTLRNFLTYPNNGRNSEDINLNVEWCQDRFLSLGFETQVIESDGIKHVYAQREVQKGAPFLLFYMQIDGQPVDTAEWNQKSPYQAVLKSCVGADCQIIDWKSMNGKWDPDWKIFARSASDSKGPALAFMEALLILKNNKIDPMFNMKVIMDFQEELGSPTLPPLVEKNRDLLKAEAILVMDGTRHPSNLPTLTFGARGIATMTLTVYGASRDLHSGQYGNFAPNPVFQLSKILAGMKDENGKVLIPGYYEGISLSEERKAVLNDLPESKSELLRQLGLSTSDAVGDTYQEALQYPSLNVRGLKAAWVGRNVRTIIPAEAIAEIDMRLVPESPGERQVKLVEEFIRSQGFYIIDSLPTANERLKYSKLIRVQSRIGSKPFRTDLNSELGVWLGKAMDRTFGQGNYIKMQSTGGSQPIAPFISTLNIPAISVRIPNPDNSIHAPNENLRLGNFHEGIRTCLGILTQKYEGDE